MNAKEKAKLTADLNGLREMQELDQELEMVNNTLEDCGSPVSLNSRNGLQHHNPSIDNLLQMDAAAENKVKHPIAITEGQEFVESPQKQQVTSLKYRRNNFNSDNKQNDGLAPPTYR